MTPESELFTTPSLKGIHLHLLRWGERSRPPLLLLHGGGANAHWWDHLAPSLARRFHVCALDFRGHGDSERPEELFTGAFSDDLEALCSHLGGGGSQPISLLGHSMGAHVAMRHAAVHDDVRSLVLIDPSRGGARKSTRRLRLALTFRRSYPSPEEAIRRYRFVPGAERASDALREAIARSSLGQDADGRWGYKFDPRWFSLPPGEKPLLSEIRCPTLIVRGEQSGVLTREGAQALLDELPGARLVEVPDAGHHVQLDQPRAVLALLDEFL